LHQLKTLRYEDLFVVHDREEVPDMSGYLPHTHEVLELYMFVAGTVTFCVESTEYTMHPGDFLIMRPGESHFAQVNPNDCYERMYVEFSPKLLSQTLNGKLLDPFFQRPEGVMNHYSAEELSSDITIPCMKRLFSGPEDARSMRVLSYILPILQEIHDCWQKKHLDFQIAPPTTIGSQMVAYINQHLNEIRNPEELAQTFFLSESQANRIFRKTTGTSIWEYVRTKRLFSARELLNSGIKPHEAATTCGYQDYSTFYRAYKKQFGCSPQKDLHHQIQKKWL